MVFVKREKVMKNVDLSEDTPSWWYSNTIYVTSAMTLGKSETWPR